MTLPNTLVIGPPKTGTTSLWHYMGQHPDVFMSAFKEPAFFWTEAPAWKTNRVETLDDYAKLFEGAAGFTAIGEASPAYFADPGAPDAIRSTLDEVRLISLLRDPRDRTFSAFTFQRMREFEPEANVIDAVNSDASRSREERVMYIDQGLYFKHLTRYLEVFPEDRLLVVFNDDLRERPDELMAEIFSFVGVDPEVDIDTSSELTVSGEPRIRAFHTLLSNRNPLKRALVPFLPESLRKRGRRVRDANLERRSMTTEERRALRPFFEDDIRRLQSLVGRDLSHWLDD